MGQIGKNQRKWQIQADGGVPSGPSGTSMHDGFCRDLVFWQYSVLEKFYLKKYLFSPTLKTEKEREISSICCLTPQMPVIPMAGPGRSVT